MNIAAGASTSHFETLDAEFDARSGFNFEKQVKAAVGHLTKFTLGGVSLEGDIEVAKPTDASETKVIGIFDYAKWAGSATDPMTLVVRIGAENRSKLNESLLKKGNTAEVEVCFEIFDYDHSKDEYYVRLGTDGQTPVKGVISKGTKVEVANNASTDVEHPMNFPFSIQISPKSAAKQQLVVGTSTTAKVMADYGVF